jgi:hypothetical protein
MLHWLAENQEGAAENLQKFLANAPAPASAPEKMQTARFVLALSAVQPQKH